MIDDYPILKPEEIHQRRFTESKFKTSKMSDRHIVRYDFFNVIKSPSNPGDYFLYETLKYHNNDSVLSYPRLGIYMNAYPCDQTISVEWFDVRRTWEGRYRMSNYSFVYEERSIIQEMPLWSEQMLIYGVWEKIPNWTQLREAYEKTLCYYRPDDILRDIKIDRLLNGI